MTMAFSYILWDCQNKTKERAKSWKEISVLLISRAKVRTEPLSIWAMASSWNIRATTFKFITGEKANGRLMFWSANWFSWIALSVCARISEEALLTFLYSWIFCQYWPCFCYCQSYTGISQVELTVLRWATQWVNLCTEIKTLASS